MLRLRKATSTHASALQEGWVIANHILVAFHIAFISSVLALPAEAILKWEVLGFIFASAETVVSALFMYLTFHICVTWHELGHFLAAVRLNALNESALAEVKRRRSQPAAQRVLWYLKLFVQLPYGRAVGVKREGLNYYVDAPYNLAVAAAGPRASRNAALLMLPPAVALLAFGLIADQIVAIYAGRLLLGIGTVSLLDFLLADPGKYRAFSERERAAEAKAASVGEVGGWSARAPEVKRRMLGARVQTATHPRLGPVTAPWQFRNCGMGGRHTEKEYPESNISMQEAMFLILAATSYQEAQELTVRLQNRLKEIIEKEDGCRVMGIGLEGGLAPYIEKAEYPLPEVRLWAMMKRAIAECGCRPGVDVAIALDPAMTELELAYRDEFNVPDAVGVYLFWRDKAKTVLDRDGVLALFLQAIETYEIPLLSIEDGFSENDNEGWRLLRERLGEQVFIIGDDLVTTNDKTIEEAADQGLINCALIKANQIGSLYETLLAMLVALGKGLELVVSHRSKSPNDDMEAQIAVAVNALGLKAGGGANTERLIKYQSVAELLQSLDDGALEQGLASGSQALVRRIRAYEEPTNAGIPTVGSRVDLWLPAAGVSLRFKGATPLGTSAGSGEAIHLVDAFIEHAEHREVVERFPGLFRDVELGVHAFRSGLDDARIHAEDNEALSELFRRAQRYGGKGCLTAVENVATIIAPCFEGKDISALTLLDVDRALLSLELRTASRRGKLADVASDEERCRIQQRKQNIGMNAMLSVSLALGRAIARIQGKELFELLREEIFAIIARLAARYDVSLDGSRFEDYVEALRKVTARVERDGRPLYAVLRELTGIYAIDEKDAARAPRVMAPPTRRDLAPSKREGAKPDLVQQIRPFVPARPVDERPVRPPKAALALLNSIAARLGEHYRDDPHHGLRHSYDLLCSASRLVAENAIAAPVDWNALAAAVALHDVAADQPEHGIDGARRAAEVLRSLTGFPAGSVKRAADAIVLHEQRSADGAMRRQRAGLESQLLFDADQLDAFGPKGIYRYVAIYAQRQRPLDRVAEDVEARYHALSFDATRAMVDQDYHYSVAFFERLARERAESERHLGASAVVKLIEAHLDEPPAALARHALAELTHPQDATLGDNAGGNGVDYAFATEYFRALLDAFPPLAESELNASDDDGSTTATDETDAELLEMLGRALFSALVTPNAPDLPQALQGYLALKPRLGSPARPFGIVNNRLYRADDGLVVPYLLGPRVLVHRVGPDGTSEVAAGQYPPGTIYTDRMLLDLAHTSGTPVDLESLIYRIEPTQTAVTALARIRDAAALLERINATTNRNQAVFWLRTLAAHLSHISVRRLIGAKNLQPEIRVLTTQLLRYLNSPLPRRLRFLSRLVVRNLSSLVGKPNVIDRLWNDTIELAEVRVPGSTIVNEIRRSCHHALGKRTLQLAQAYHQFLRHGEMAGLSALGFSTPSAADIAAQETHEARELTARVVEDLQRLLGTAQIITRVEEWQEAYSEALTRCEFGSSLQQELETLVKDGFERRNRWVSYHHLRIIENKISGFWRPESMGQELRALIAQLSTEAPDDDSFAVAESSRSLRQQLNAFVDALYAAHRDPLFEALDEAIAAQREERFFDAFAKTREVRQLLVRLIDQPAFDSQRYYLFQLEGLLEEMGYLAARHVDTRYQEQGVDLDECLEIIRLAAMNLPLDGLNSRELNDFASMLADPARSEAELLDVLRSIERIYHRMRQRVTLPFEKMQRHLGLPDADLTKILANIRRYMHDLNTMVHFADLAATFVRERIASGETLRPSRTAPGIDAIAEPVVHLSDRDAVAEWVERPIGIGSLRANYGGKGTGLLYISYLNVPTRDGFIFPTSYGRTSLYREDETRLREELQTHLETLERAIRIRDGVEKRFGDAAAMPLLLAVRGGSVISMPGILATVVFVGMNDAIAERLAVDGPWRAYDSYRRFLASFGAAVWGVDIEQRDLVERTKEQYGVRYKHELPWEAMKAISEESKQVIRDEGFGDALDAMLNDPLSQLFHATRAVFESWNTRTAQRFRDIKGIAHSWNTAAIVQEMAFGNGRNEAIEPGMDETLASLTGVITRTYPTEVGARAFEGEVKFSAAGDDLVSGITFSNSFRPVAALEELMPMLENRLKHNVAKIRRFMGTDQEVEFTVERGILSVLQTRRSETHIDQATDRFFDPGEPATRGLGVRGGGFRGLAIFDEADLAELSRLDLSERDDVDGLLLVIENPIPDDIPLIISAGGLLTARGGSTSHAAVAVNGIEGREYSGVMSAANLDVDAERHEAVIRNANGTIVHRIKRGDVVSVHGTTGEVYVGSRRRQQAG